MAIGRTVTALSLLTVGSLLWAAPTVLAQAQQGADAPAAVTTLKRDYRDPPPRSIENQALADLGRELFFDSRISASGKTACASCHVPRLGWAVTEARSRNDSGKLTPRKSQPLIGLGHVGNVPVGWDGRSATLEAQAKGSIVTGAMSMRDTDTPVKAEVIEARISSIPNYVAMFNSALPGKPINIDTIAQAVAAFERTIEPGLSPFDLWVDGNEAAISESAKRGFALFTGRAGCSGCHSGWRFTDDNFHDIGATTTDQGRGAVVGNELLNFAFKTPTLRSVALRAPYMHDGSMAALSDVVRHYEQGGIPRKSRSPLMRPIPLTDQERLDLVAFVETLTAEGP
jgi:cytochrome c peroxidase